MKLLKDQKNINQINLFSSIRKIFKSSYIIHLKIHFRLIFFDFI